MLNGGVKVLKCKVSVDVVEGVAGGGEVAGVDVDSSHAASKVNEWVS